MPIIIEGYVVASTKTLLDHADHSLTVPRDDLGTRLWCSTCAAEIAREHRSTSLPCGCTDRAEHRAGLVQIAKWRGQYRIPASSCVGCYMGDDGPSLHECAIHPV